MALESKESNNENKEVIKEEPKMQYHWYLFSFFVIYYGSYLIPGLLFFLYILLVLIPNVMATKSFISLFTELTPLLSMIIFPLVIIICYLLHLFFIALITRVLWQITEKKSPTKDGTIPRNIRSRTLNFYHIRSFMIKYPKYVFTKGIFPWLSNWLFNFVGSDKIGKGTTIEEQICADKYIDIGKNCYIGVGSVLTSHLVEGIFGNIVYFELKLGDNVTFGGSNNYACGCKFGDNCFLMPWASGGKHYVVSGDNFYSGLPLRKIFKKQINECLKIPLNIIEEEKKYRSDPNNLKNLQDTLKAYNDNKSHVADNQEDSHSEEVKEESNVPESNDETDFALDFTTSSAISKINLKFLALYVPILWFSGFMISILWYEYTKNKPPIQVDPINWISTFLFLPVMLFLSILLFLGFCLIFTKLFLVLINLIHKPKEGVFKAEVGNTDFDFWCLRTQVKKLPVFLSRNCPIPYLDAWTLRWLGLSMDFSSHLNDAWCDLEFVDMGRGVMVGQGAVIMSSMVVGKYLIIKKTFIDDYVVVGGQDTIAPGTIFGKDTVTGALSTTNYCQILEDGWIYFGIPVIKLKRNTYAESSRDFIRKVEVDTDKKYEVKHDVNIDEDKKDLVK